ncbi:hypothetical protein Mth01_34440 [Sphaerimonospora thailandensis]|uniref:Uncharacterized protein n=1 Tax=Sphaerimonospora thailandensis TaxID=795644 RepID=A0A8J3W0W6_9ACTN|nr:hypothetical protein Mth01_34440 [Sphaerimonospora thailandensis]
MRPATPVLFYGFHRGLRRLIGTRHELILRLTEPCSIGINLSGDFLSSTGRGRRMARSAAGFGRDGSIVHRAVPSVPTGEGRDLHMFSTALSTGEVAVGGAARETVAPGRSRWTGRGTA